jgi:zinc/manganese transport system permease protein
MNPTAVVQLLLPSFCLCLLMVGMLSYLGIHVIKREIIFVDLALAQIAALGALVALLLGIPLYTQASYWFSIALTAIAAAVFTLTRSRETRVPQEAIIGLVYAIAAATAIILIDKAPHGAEHIKDILTGSILWVQWRTVVLVGTVYAAIGLFHFAFRRPFLLISTDPDAARAQGLRVGLWDFLFYLTFGFVITVSVGSAGVLLVFVFLVAPAVMAVLITDRLLYQLLVGWALGLVATTSGLVISYVGDLSSGPLVIAAYAVTLIVVSAVVRIVRAPDRARALNSALAIAATFAACFALLLLVGRAVGARSSGHAHEHHHDHAKGAAAPHGPGEPAVHHTAALDIIRPGDPDQSDLAARFDAEKDPSTRADLVCEALEANPAVGAALALRYLEDDPPLFFAQAVVDALDAGLPKPSGFDVEQPFTAPANQTAAERIRAGFGRP